MQRPKAIGLPLMPRVRKGVGFSFRFVSEFFAIVGESFVDHPGLLVLLFFVVGGLKIVASQLQLPV